MPSGSIAPPRTIASRSSAERTSISSSCWSLVMRWRDCHRQSFHSASVAVGKKRWRKASVCGLIDGSRRCSGSRRARFAAGGGGGRGGGGGGAAERGGRAAVGGG